MATSSRSVDEPGDERLPVGARVELRVGFDRSWARGFEIAEDLGDGYLILRRSDGSTLPTAFPDDAVRREHKRSMWWV